MARSVRIAVFICTLVWIVGGSAQTEDTERQALEAVKDHKAIWTVPPTRTPADHSVDGPLMGNGDMGVCLGGPPEALRFFLSKNDFWKLKSEYGSSGPRVFGSLDIVIGSMKGADYRVEQTIRNGVTVVLLEKDARRVQVTSWVAATDNMLVIELAALGYDIDARVSLQVSQGNGSTVEEGQDGPLTWAVRKFVHNMDIPTEAAAAMKPISRAATTAFSLSTDSPVTLVLAMTSRFKHDEPLTHVKTRLSDFNAKDLEQLRHAHEQWWAQYWSRSWVEIDDPILEKAYYQSLYSMAAASRDPEFPPGIFGTWVTTDSPSWAGDYHLNYNHMAPFYGLYSANRLAQADPQDAPLLDFRERGRWYAEQVTETRGVLYPVGIGPKGIETTRNAKRYRESPNFEKGGLFFRRPTWRTIL